MIEAGILVGASHARAKEPSGAVAELHPLQLAALALGTVPVGVRQLPCVVPLLFTVGA